ncbi:DNA methyltransferase [Thiotrichales bacterium HSG1]|nr:DNA methyltransferase [Thiotrichales bacterium HSG1]
MNKLILGDNQEILRSLETESVDLIYLDPPFFSNRNYEVIWGDEGEVRSFQDRWSGGIDHYIAWLKERVIELHRILKPTGSIFLHCDWHADAYIRVFILDKVFGEENFRNEIIWCYSTGGRATKFYPKKHDILFWYSKSKKYNFYYNNVAVERDTSTMHEPILYDSKGKPYQRNIKNGKEYKYYLDKGVLPNDWWTDIQALNPSAKERIGYPTQKPEALLERIILCASNEGDIVLDPFVGGGTTVAVADKLKRHWMGIDQSVQAVKVSELRLQKQQDLFSKPFTVQLHKYDYDTLRYSDAFEFETWIIQQYDGTPNTKQRGDKGIDGKTRDGVPIQVKRSDNVGRNVVDNFVSASKRFDKSLFDKNSKNNKAIGYIIAFSFGKGAIQEVARLKNQDNLIIQLITVEEIIPIAKKPKLTVNFEDLGLDNKKLREIEFTATGKSEAGIEFYAWDFNYNGSEGFKAQIMIDKKGKQTHKFKTGDYQIAVKVVDNEGLENLEVIKLKVNGEVKS